jgi:hypothetical protein
MWIEYVRALRFVNINNLNLLCVLQADLVRTPGEIFQYMQSNKIGERVALFWIAWAFITEKTENFRMTDQIFQKAIRRMAEPKDLLNKRYQQFQRRLARHFLNKPDEEMNDSSVDRQQPSVPARQVLGRLNAAQSEGSSSRVNPSATSNSHSNQRGVGIATDSRVHAPPKTAAVSLSARAMNFTIFSEEPQRATSSAAQSTSDLLAENSSWTTLGSEQERRKENEGDVLTGLLCLTYNPTRRSSCGLVGGTSPVQQEGRLVAQTRPKRFACSAINIRLCGRRICCSTDTERSAARSC